jgi:LysR family transcriptional regulator, nitrogen assimilation regulatory protein
VDLRQLRYFIQAANAENLTHASGKAWISQSALSRQIKLLEDELGVQLFQRRARGVKLTAPGLLLKQRAEILLRDAASLTSDVQATKQVPTGTLRVGTPTSLQSLLTVPFLAEYQRRYSAVLVVHRHGTAKSMHDALAEGELDLAISDMQTLTLFVKQALLSEAMCLVAPLNMKLRMDKPVSVKRAIERPQILTSYPNRLRVMLDSQLRSHRLESRPIIETDASQLMLALIQSDVGTTVLPYSGAHEALMLKNVSASPVKGMRIQWAAAYSRERSCTLATQRAVELMQEICRSCVLGGHWLSAKLPR